MSKPKAVDDGACRGAIADACAELGWKSRVQTSGGRTLVICPLPKNKQFAGAVFVVSGSARRLAVSVSYRTKLPAERWPAMSEVAARVNSGLLGGCLDLDFTRGEVRYRDGFLLVAPGPDAELLRATVATALRDAATLLPAVEAVAAGGTPTEAMAALKTG